MPLDKYSVVGERIPGKVWEIVVFRHDQARLIKKIPIEKLVWSTLFGASVCSSE
uniref:Uncharacterized protein n=1 Tax=Candidozyma auris TaxID=498019 RepID=A0A0L0P1M6_CANAR